MHHHLVSFIISAKRSGARIHLPHTGGVCTCARVRACVCACVRVCGRGERSLLAVPYCLAGLSALSPAIISAWVFVMPAGHSPALFIHISILRGLRPGRAFIWEPFPLHYLMIHTNTQNHAHSGTLKFSQNVHRYLQKRTGRAHAHARMHARTRTHKMSQHSNSLGAATPWSGDQSMPCSRTDQGLL